MPTTETLTPRARARAQTLARIKDLARRQMGAEGAAALSLRSLARDIGVTSSAIYRYYDSRNTLLTELIEEGWTGTADAMAAADAAVDPDDVAARFRAMGLGLRRWALANPVDFALLYGQPIPGYVAPASTASAAARGWAVYLAPFVHAAELGLFDGPPPGPDLPDDLHRRLACMPIPHADALPPSALAAALAAWGHAVGLIGLELYHHLDAVSGDHTDQLYDWSLDHLAARIFHQNR